MVLLGLTLGVGSPPPENSRVNGLNYLELYMLAKFETSRTFPSYYPGGGGGNNQD